MTRSPVLLVTFNRPDTTQKVFDAIKEAKPQKLYVFNDGPRLGNKGDIQAREEIRKILQTIDWQCEVSEYFSEKNLGCGLGVSGAITWAFRKEDRLIVLEDDTVPAISFFSYCDYLLEKFKDDSRISLISGNNFTEDINSTDDSYFFSKYGHIWGWATWKRVWDNYDFMMKDWPKFRDSSQLLNIFHKKKEQQFYLNFFDKIFNAKEKTTWDSQWFYCRVKHYGLSILPKDNLVTNIGVQGIHTNTKSKTHFVKANKDFVITKEPEYILCNSYYDENHFKQIIDNRRPVIIRVFRKIFRIIKKLFNKS